MTLNGTALTTPRVCMIMNRGNRQFETRNPHTEFPAIKRERILANRVFHIRTEMAIVAFSSLLRENQKVEYQNVTPSGNRAQVLKFQVQHAPEGIACKAKTLGSLYSRALLILTESSKYKNQVVHAQKFKDLPSSKCPG